MDTKTIGKWLFVIAVLLAILGAYVDLSNEWIQTIVLLVAFFGAYLWIDMEHKKQWLLVAVALYFFSGALGGLVFIGEHLDKIFGAIGAMFGVAALSLVVKKIVGWFM
jgi:TctA family transporter